jgi:hypothetical protein
VSSRRLGFLQVRTLPVCPSLIYITGTLGPHPYLAPALLVRSRPCVSTESGSVDVLLDCTRYTCLDEP